MPIKIAKKDFDELKKEMERWADISVRPCTSYKEEWNRAIVLGEVYNILNNCFDVKEELPICPVCGGELNLVVGLGEFLVKCSAPNCIILSIGLDKAEALKLFWETPYGKMCKEREY